MVVWKGASRQTYAILGASFFIALALVVIPIGQQIWMLATGAFIVMAAAPIAAASSQTLWQKKVDATYQGRVFSLRNTIMRSAQPLAFLSAGFLADNYFEPYMVEGGLFAQYFGEIWGTGQGRGVALMISFAGALSAVIVACAWLVPGIRRADIDLPDVVAEAKEGSPDPDGSAEKT